MGWRALGTGYVEIDMGTREIEIDMGTPRIDIFTSLCVIWPDQLSHLELDLAMMEWNHQALHFASKD